MASMLRIFHESGDDGRITIVADNPDGLALERRFPVESPCAAFMGEEVTIDTSEGLSVAIDL
ncbi:hypothetical protein [Oligoflexus sp.]|uniref:hypothetical protein n=1 Tax=Oligoflexus sp. TaxID=1971216 RepID=UPI0039C93F99